MKVSMAASAASFKATGIFPVIKCGAAMAASIATFRRCSLDAIPMAVAAASRALLTAVAKSSKSNTS